jgi:hypothetical protein
LRRRRVADKRVKTPGVIVKNVVAKFPEGKRCTRKSGNLQNISSNKNTTSPTEKFPALQYHLFCSSGYCFCNSLLFIILQLIPYIIVPISNIEMISLIRLHFLVIYS